MEKQSTDTIDNKPYNEINTIGKKKRNALIIIVCALALIITASAVIGPRLVGFLTSPEGFGVWLERNKAAAAVIFILIMALQVVIAFIPGEPFEVASGYAFGKIWGCVICLIACLIGSSLIFLMVRRFGVKAAKLFFSEEKLKKLEFIKSGGKTEFYAFILFLIPGTPKDILTYAAGLSPISPHRFLLLSSIARIPSIITSSVFGGALAKGQYVYGAAIYGATFVVSLIGAYIYRKFVDKKSVKHS